MLKNTVLKQFFGLEASVEINHEIYPLLLLARDVTGYFDLVKITSEICLSERGAISLEALSLYREHLFVISACKEGIIERLILKELDSEALKYLELFKNTLIILCRITKPWYCNATKLNERLVALATLQNIPICVTNEVRYLNKDEALL